MGFGRKHFQDFKAVLLDNRVKKWILIELVRFEKKHVRMWKLQWKGSLKKKRGLPYPDAHWDWSSIFSTLLGDSKQEGYCVEYEEQLQGILVISTANKVNDRGEPAVFVEYLATAPWNRADNAVMPAGEGRFSNTGVSLLAYAVARSRELGWKGRITLESEVESVHFYEKIGMKMKRTDRDGIAYFEFGQETAEIFIGRFQEKVQKAASNLDKS